MITSKTASGLPFVKVDLHIHTPVSRCHDDNMSRGEAPPSKPEDTVHAALKAGLKAIAITDHNAAEGIDAIRQVATVNGLVIFPGVELSARGGHVLAIFEQDFPTKYIRALVAEAGFSENQWGDGFYQSPLWMDELFQKIGAMGGLAIAAHVDRAPRGFIAGIEPRPMRRRIHESEFLSALELTAYGDKARWNDGSMPNYPKPYATIQSSDAHAPREVGRRPIHIAVPRIDLDALRLAFREYHLRIRFPQELET